MVELNFGGDYAFQWWLCIPVVVVVLSGGCGGAQVFFNEIERDRLNIRFNN